MPPVFIYTMPAVNSNSNQSGSGSPPQRTTFRPPWVKEGPNPLPMPSAPWTAKSRESSVTAEDAPRPEKPTLRKQSKISIIPSQPAVVDTDKGGSEHFGVKLQPVAKASKEPQQPQSRVIEITTESKKVQPEEKASKSKNTSNVDKVAPAKLQSTKQSEGDQRAKLEKMNSFSKSASKAHLPPKPPAPPMPPPPPPQPSLQAPPDFKKQPLTQEKVAKLDMLRSRPRRRPDWTDMMKEVESGRKLKHVQCNDRSAPVLPKTKAKGQFVYESEKDNAHNILLKQIQKGICLKKTVTNDRSKPILEGLRKFRRQMTIEEQIQKSASVADVVAVAAEPDELDDIDKVRDDLQSTKQMLALELRNKEALERENKRLVARLLNLEVELEKEKAAAKTQVSAGNVVQVQSEENEKLVNQLKQEVTDANKVAKEMEDQYRKTAEELDATRAKLETAWLRNQQLEVDLKQAHQGTNLPIMKQPSSKRLANSMSNGRLADESEDESELDETTETESESEEEDTEAAQERRTQRELKLLTTKLRSYKEKQGLAQKERRSLKEQLKKQQNVLKDEKKKYKILQKEVDKMAKLMKDADDEDEEEAEEKSDEEEEEEESETDSDSEESEADEESEGDLPEDASTDDRKQNLTRRAKNHENRLSSLKKGNYLLKANIDRVQDDINKQREMSLTLQEDLNSVLAELG